MSGKKLLVADDSLTIQKVIRLALSHEGYEIQAVSDGAEAVEQLLLFRPQVVLIDVSLPGKSATEVKTLADEKPELRDVRFVLMSSAFEQVDEAAIQKAGFHGRLTKPFDPAHLRRVLQDCLEQVPAAAPTEFPPLWDAPQSATPSAPTSPPPFHSKPAAPMSAPAPAPANTPDVESDIRELTQSTLKMAGFDDFEWSVSEGAKKEPAVTLSTPPPTPATLPSFELEPSLPPLPKMSLGSPPSQAPDEVFQQPIKGADYTKTLAGLDLPLHTELHTAAPMDEAKIEALVQQRVDATLARMSKELLPQIAERLIKQEIHRLLGEGP